MVTAHARRMDPETSHEAASSVRDITDVQKLILQLLATRPCIDEKLVSIYTDQIKMNGWPKATPQSIRSRRAELVELGLLEWIGLHANTETGRRARVWGLTFAGCDELFGE